MRAYDIIYKKRNGESLSRNEIEFMTMRYSNGDIPDYQMAAFIMAVFIKGMDKEEIYNLTDIMAHSGDIIDWSLISNYTADKHSTGGVGDGTSLIVAPVVAACGVCVPMMSGRGLGHTGGTLDKLESIPGFRTNLDNKEFIETVEIAGCALIGQTHNIAPADKKIYALRDAIAAVESIPLICASIMSKKIAEGAKTLILDVKTGSGAFMSSYAQSIELAKEMIDTAKKTKINSTVFITDMDEPLGDCAGNANEVKQAINILKGEIKNDLSYLSIELAAAMIFGAKKSQSLDEARKIALHSIESGTALEKFREVIRLQGGNTKVIDDPDSVLSLKTKEQYLVKAGRDGYISHMRTRDMGMACSISGAGREKIDDKIDNSAGIYFYKKTGDYVKTGEVLASIKSNKKDSLRQAALIMDDAYLISDDKPAERKIIKEIIT
ncbi:MAG: thymidine phosphorylase [Elusimicrobiota bacterium]|jgi:pyrimidine-nucleoside phosphorylase|nr:thymidine phosphorylase [Elusimicrobiota bacterium]